MNATIITRSEYMAATGSELTRMHHLYYGQFVSPLVMSIVKRAIGVAAIKASMDPHMNDIGLAKWDHIAPLVNSYAAAMLREAGDYPTLSSGVCIAKATARAIKAA